jgi:hypothetical protein
LLAVTELFMSMTFLRDLRTSAHPNWSTKGTLVLQFGSNSA